MRAAKIDHRLVSKFKVPGNLGQRHSDQPKNVGRTGEKVWCYQLWYGVVSNGNGFRYVYFDLFS